MKTSSSMSRRIEILLFSSFFLIRYVSCFFSLSAPGGRRLSQRLHQRFHNRKASSALYFQQQSHSSNATFLTVEDDLFMDDETLDYMIELNRQFLELQALQEEAQTNSLFTTTTEMTHSHLQNTVQHIPNENKGISDAFRARLLLLGAAALYGTNFSLVKWMNELMPVGINSSLRFGLAALCTLPWLLKDSRKDGALMASWLGFEVGLWNSIGYVSQAVGLETTPASESAFICSLAVVVVPILDFATGKLLLSRQWIGAILALTGVAFLEMGGDSLQSFSTGDALSLIQPFAFGFGFWRMEKAMHRYPDQASRMTAAQLFAVFFASTAYAFFTTDLDVLQSYPWLEWFTDPSVLIALFWTGAITTALSIYMENLALETLSATETTLIFTTEPLWGTAFAVLVMGEEFGCNAAVGATLIVIACIYSNLGIDGLLSLIPGNTRETKEGKASSSLSALVAVPARLMTGFASSLNSALFSPMVATAASEEVSESMNDSIQRIFENRY